MAAVRANSDFDALEQVRGWQPRDDVQALTRLLHRAYAPLGAMGLNFTAVDQSAEVTQQRLHQGQCFVAEVQGQIAGCVGVAGPLDALANPWAADAPLYCERGVARFYQLAVDPVWQGKGIGDTLVHRAELWALAGGLSEMACDTAAPATHLRRRYARLGYAEVGETQWVGKTYKSVLLRQALPCQDPKALAEARKAHYREVLRWQGMLHWDDQPTQEAWLALC